MDMVRATSTRIADDGPPSGEDLHLQALVAAVGRKNQAALRELYTLTSPRLLLAFETAGDPGLLEDVLVATYARVWRTEAARQSCRAGVMPWLTGVAAAELITQGRQRRRTIQA
jgi:DNA-directed RNA polymerase specialized sigma24 family protein